VSSPVVSFQRLLTVEILQLHALKFSLNGGCLPTELSSDWVRVRVRFASRLAIYRQSVIFAKSPLRLTAQQFYFTTKHFRLWSLCNILSDERMGLSFTTAAGPRPRNHSLVIVPRDSLPHFTVSDSRLPKHGGTSPRIYIPKEQASPAIHPGTGFLFVASYDSQGDGGGILLRLHTGVIGSPQFSFL
jgi:hypothetical protein